MWQSWIEFRYYADATILRKSTITILVKYKKYQWPTQEEGVGYTQCTGHSSANHTEHTQHPTTKPSNEGLYTKHLKRKLCMSMYFSFVYPSF